MLVLLRFGFPGQHLLRTLRDHVLHNHVYVPWSVVLLSVAGALCFALSSVLEQQAASDQPPELALRLSLLVRLLLHPRWLLGNLAGGAGFFFQLLALRTGSLALVQPIFVCGLAFAIPGSAAMERRWLSLREWATTGLIVGGLVLFIAAARPGRGSPHASTAGWLALGAITILSVGVLLALARGASQRRQALALGSAAGILLGSTAAVIERTGYQLHHGGLGHALSSWSPYVLILAMVAALVLIQTAFQVGDLKHSLPALTVLEPLVAVLIGQLLFAEHIALHGLAPLGEALGLVLMTVGVVGLAAAPTRQGGHRPGSDADRSAAPAPDRGQGSAAAP